MLLNSHTAHTGIQAAPISDSCNNHNLVWMRRIGYTHFHGIVMASNPHFVLYAVGTSITVPAVLGLVTDVIQASPPPIASRNALPKTEVRAALMCSCSPAVPTNPALP